MSCAQWLSSSRTGPWNIIKLRKLLLAFLCRLHCKPGSWREVACKLCTETPASRNLNWSVQAGLRASSCGAEMHCLVRAFLNLLLKGKHAFLRLPNSKDLLESRFKKIIENIFWLSWECTSLKHRERFVSKTSYFQLTWFSNLKPSPSVSVFVSECVTNHIVLFGLLWGGEQWTLKDIYLSVIRFLKWHSTRDTGLALIMNHKLISHANVLGKFGCLISEVIMVEMEIRNFLCTGVSILSVNHLIC